MKGEAVNDGRGTSGLRILLTDSKRWAVGVRIGMVFAEMGCEVGMLCPSEGHPAGTVRSIHHRFAYDGFRPVASLRAAIERFQPDLIVPTCDRGVRHLHALYAGTISQGPRWIAERIERSLGSAGSFPIVSNRHALLTVAREEGIRIPQTIALEHERDLARAGSIGLPLVVKADGTWGGCGVMVARTAAELRHACNALRARQGVPWLLRELALNRDRGNTLHDWKHAKPDLVAQAFVRGKPGNCAVACAEGRILAGIAVEALATNGERGPASMIDVVEGREMMQAAERIARRLKLSGFFGLDFMIEHGTGAAFLIEMNPRSTQPCSLALGRGRNLPVAMCAVLAGRPEPETARVTPWNRIAYFPQPVVSMAQADLPEQSYYYDVPANEPGFVRRLMEQWPDRSLLGQWVDRMKGVDRGTASTRTKSPRLREAVRTGIARMVDKGLQTGTR